MELLKKYESNGIPNRTSVRSEQVFDITFKAQWPDGKPFVKQFKIKATDKYTALDTIKEKLGVTYDKLFYPKFIFGEKEKAIAPDYISAMKRGLKEG